MKTFGCHDEKGEVGDRGGPTFCRFKNMKIDITAP